VSSTPPLPAASRAPGAAVEPARAPRVTRVVLPAYNEAESLPALLAALQEHMDEHGLAYEVIVVDDGSRDRTAAVAAEWAERLPLVVVPHAVNQGLGAALRDGLAAAVARAGARDVVVTMDADDTHPPGLIARLLDHIDAGHDVVIASRYRPGSRVCGVPQMRRVMSNGASLLMRCVFPLRGVRDYTCGYRAYRVEVLRRALEHYGDTFVDQSGFQCMVDVLLKLSRLDLVFGEVPLVLRYDRKLGVSKMPVGDTVWSTLRLMLHRRLGR
jgi:dolichol-phosphate mannosyltransferase